MRNISKWVVSSMLLATQAYSPLSGFVAATAEASSNATGVYEVKLNTKTAAAIEIIAAKKPDFETDVLIPLRAAQAETARKVAEAEAAKADAEAKAIAAANAAAAKAKVQAAVQMVSIQVTGSAIDCMREAGIAESDFGYVDYIISSESGWSATKHNYAGSGAYGLGQALPASKMSAYGSDYLTNPVTQLKWADAYAKGRFGTWANAYAYWTVHHNW